MYNILILEDDARMANELKVYLENRGFHCDIIFDGTIFSMQLNITKYDLYVLDVNVPVLNGIEVCKRLRLTDEAVPILMLTAYSAVEDKVNAFDAGADDYLVKPFHLEELLVRINALLRRRGQAKEGAKHDIVIDDLVIDTLKTKVTRAGKEIVLTPKEYKLLLVLALAGGNPVSKQVISSKVWDINFETGTNTIEVYINYLRNKIDKGHQRNLLHTRPGFGYYLK